MIVCPMDVWSEINIYVDMEKMPLYRGHEKAIGNSVERLQNKRRRTTQELEAAAARGREAARLKQK